MGIMKLDIIDIKKTPKQRTMYKIKLQKNHVKKMYVKTGTMQLEKNGMQPEKQLVWNLKINGVWLENNWNTTWK